ncbi:hypothetical protein HY636_03625 [Candidatus Woesearchaeota archaeon]|nr:hypothetical protein [Candidatus Woesearchaeota archaeon]
MISNPWVVSTGEREHNKSLDQCILRNLRDILVRDGIGVNDVGIFGENVHTLDECNAKKIVLYSVGSSSRDTYLPDCADTDIDVVINQDDTSGFKHFIMAALQRDVPALDSLSRMDSDFDAQPRMSYTYRRERRVDLSIRPKYDVRTLEYILSVKDWTEDSKLEMRKTKHFFRTLGVYHRSNHGINGITVERMILMYGNLGRLCAEILKAGLPNKHFGSAKPKREEIVPLEKTSFEVCFPTDSGKGLFKQWVCQNPKMWQRIVLGAYNYLRTGEIGDKTYDYGDFNKEYSSEGWHVFKINAKLKNVKDIERILFEKTKRYFESHRERIRDYDIYSWGDELWVSMKPRHRKKQQHLSNLIEENVKLFRNAFFFELNPWMKYKDPEDFTIKPRTQLTNHGHTPSGSRYVILVSNQRYFQLLKQLVSSDPKYKANLVGSFGTGGNIMRYSFGKTNFDIVSCTGQTSAAKWAEICIGFGARYIINIGMVGSLVDEHQPGNFVISGEFCRMDREGADMGTDPYSFYFAPMPTKIVSSPTLVDALIYSAGNLEIDYSIVKMATVPVYYQDFALIRRLRETGFATTVDEEATNIAAVMGFRSQKVGSDDSRRLHFGGIYFISDVYPRTGGHLDHRDDFQMKERCSILTLKAAIDAFKYIDKGYVMGPDTIMMSKAS